MKFLYLIALLFVGFIGYGQNTIEVFQDRKTELFYDNLGATLKRNQLDSIQQSPTKIVRIWGGGGIYTWKDTFEFQRLFINSETQEIQLFKMEAKRPEEILTLKEVQALKSKRVIDCPTVKVEWVEHQRYVVKSLGCDREIQSKLAQIYDALISDKIDAFIQQLPSGSYYNGMRNLLVNQPIKEEAQKSNLYRKIEEEFHKNGIDISNPLQQPLIYVDNKMMYFEDLNRLKEEDLLSSFLLQGVEATAMYGSRAMYGVIVLKTSTHFN